MHGLLPYTGHTGASGLPLQWHDGTQRDSGAAVAYGFRGDMDLDQVRYCRTGSYSAAGEAPALYLSLPGAPQPHS